MHVFHSIGSYVGTYLGLLVTQQVSRRAIIVLEFGVQVEKTIRPKYIERKPFSEESVQPQLRKLAVSSFRNERSKSTNVGNIEVDLIANWMIGSLG